MMNERGLCFYPCPAPQTLSFKNEAQENTTYLPNVKGYINKNRDIE
jgi:hypothetical protein